MPYFKHDCFNPRCCRYIGSNMNEPHIDVYLYHGIQKETPNLIVRNSDDGSDYSSGPVGLFAASDNEKHKAAIFLYNKWMVEDAS